MTARLLIAIPAIALFLMASFVDAQTPSRPELGGGTRTINLTMEQRHIIKEFLADTKVERTAADATLSVGDHVPDKVQLNPLPAEIGQKVPQIKSHMFFATGDKFVLVDPKDKTIVELIEQ